jgi:multidrug efflux pump subunit AcrA (membrane-fusion protein)
VNVDIGDLVTAGQVLAEIDVPDLQAETQRREKLLVQSQKQHASMQAKLEQAKSQQQERRSLQQLRQAELERVATLVENGSLSRERLDEAKFALASAVASLASVAADIAAAEADVASAAAAIEVAQAELDKSKSMQNFRKILAPFDGLITMRQVDTGAYVVPSTDPTKALFKVEEISRLRGVIYLPLEMASQVSSGKKVEIHSVAGSKELVINEDAQGKPITITRSSGVLNQESRLMRAEIELQPPVNPTTRLVVLKPGDYATARIMLEAFPQQAAVPRSALIYEGKEKYIFIAGADQVCHKLQVNVVAQQDDWIGVTPKETIDGSLETRRVAVSNLDSIHEKQKLTDRKVTDGQVQSED